MLGELTIYAADRFWRAAKSVSLDHLPNLESALAQIVGVPHTPASKAWGAVLLHATFLETGRIGEVASSVADCVSADFPPALLSYMVGFVCTEDRIAPLSVDSIVSKEPDPRRMLTDLQHGGRLNHQAIAEIVLAVAGTKMSRITGHSSLITEVARSVKHPIFIGSQSIRSVTDAALGDFSNRSVDGGRITSLDGDFDVYAYFGGDPADQALLSVLDQMGSAGKYLGIPACCRTHFPEAWAAACRDHDGDVAFQMMSSQPQWTRGDQIDIAWQCNPYGMYFGGGLTWHFPCSLTCPETMAKIDDRFDALARINADFASDCRSFQLREFTLLPDRTVQQGAGNSLGVAIRPY